MSGDTWRPKNGLSRVKARRVLGSPQLIHAPCGFRELHFSADGIRSITHELADQEIANLSHKAYGASYPDRHGHAEDRDFWWDYPA